MQRAGFSPVGSGSVTWRASRREAVAHDLGVDRRAAGPGVLELLDHQDRRALADDEAVALEVERPATPPAGRPRASRSRAWRRSRRCRAA